MHHSSGEYKHLIRGLGLEVATARKFFGMHDGRIWIEDAPQVGARFRLTGPISAH